MATNSQNSQTSDPQKCSKLQKSIITGVLIVLAILGYHFYENFFYGQPQEDTETAEEHDIEALTQRLIADELHNPYLLKMDMQGRTKTYEQDDRASHPFIQLNEQHLSEDTTSTTYLMKRLFDNYELDTLVVENVTPEEEQEELDFLNGIMKTPAMRRTMKFLQKKGTVSPDYDAQMQLLKDIWFMQYSRGQGRVGSSGFEHVFLAEKRDKTILGLHNWIYFSEQEKLGNANYKGFIDHLVLGKDNHHLMAVRFTYHGIAKGYNTLFVGTSPEFEMSLYTVCFLLSPKKPCPVQMGTTKFQIITHSWDWHGKKTLATAYPSIE